MAGTTPLETGALIGEALGRGDLDSALELFEPDAVLVDPASGEVLRGHEQIRVGIERFVAMQPEFVPTAEPRVIEAGDVAIVLAPWAFDAPGPDGQPVRTEGIATDVLRRQPDGTWRFVIDNPPGTRAL